MKNIGTYEGKAVGLIESVYVDLVDSTEYLLGVSGETAEFALMILKGVAIVVDIIILGGEEG